MYKFLTFLFIFFAWCGVANAATLYFTEQEAVQDVRVLVNLDTDKNTINGFDITVTYDDSYLQFTGYGNENTIKPLWVVPPRSSEGGINFSGIIPGGASVTYDPNNLSNENLRLVELVFKAKKSGNTTLNVQKSSVFLNDGLGTNIEHESKGIVLNLQGTQTHGSDEELDTNPPENLTLNLIPKSKEASTPPLVVFEATDASGIAFYKIKQGNKWQEVNSPYPVRQGIFSHRIYVRAYDVYGNMAGSSLVVPSVVPTYLFVLLLGVILAGFCVYKLLK